MRWNVSSSRTRGQITWENEYFAVLFELLAETREVYVILDKERGKWVSDPADPRYSWMDPAESRAIGFAEELTDDKNFEKIVLTNEKT